MGDAMSRSILRVEESGFDIMNEVLKARISASEYSKQATAFSRAGLRAVFEAQSAEHKDTNVDGSGGCVWRGAREHGIRTD